MPVVKFLDSAIAKSELAVMVTARVFTLDSVLRTFSQASRIFERIGFQGEDVYCNITVIEHFGYSGL
jgi:hypothetical protein